MTTISIVQSNYIPWIGYFDIIRRSDVFVMYDEVQYTKNDWRNRNRIKTNQGLQWLTIPVRHERLEQPIHEVQVANQLWRRKHMQALSLAYSKAPFFKKYQEQVFSILEGEEVYLSQINRKGLSIICGILGITTRILDSQELGLSGDRNEKLLDACKKLNASTYLSGPAARAYLDTDLFNRSGIEITWADYSGYREYPQLYPPFIPGATILDFIFNMGDAFEKYLEDGHEPGKY
jgi:hypothetical protein